MKEKKRNAFGVTRIYANAESLLGKTIGVNFTDPDYVATLAPTRALNISGKVFYSTESVKPGTKIARPDDRLALATQLDSNIICCSYQPPTYKKHVPRLLPSARIPRQSITYRDILQADRKRPGECLAIRITERLMGVDRDAPTMVTTYINLRNQPHQRDFMEHDRGTSDAPMIYKTRDFAGRGRPRYSLPPPPPPGPLAVSYGPRQPQYAPRPPVQQPHYIPRPPPYEPQARTTKRAYAEEPSAAPIQQQAKRGKYEPEDPESRVGQVKAAIHTFFSATAMSTAPGASTSAPQPVPLPPTARPMTQPQLQSQYEDPRTRGRAPQRREEKKEEKKQTRGGSDSFSMFMSK